MLIDRIKRTIYSGSERSKTVKYNILGSLAIKALSIIVQLMLVPITIGYVSSELYGIWLTISSLILWLSFFDIGLSMGLKNKLTESLSNKDFSRGKRLVSTTYLITGCLFIPLMLICEIVTPYIPWYKILNVGMEYELAIGKAMSILIACFCLQMIVNVFLSVVAAYQKVALSTLFPVLGNVISLIIIIILVKTTPPSLSVLALAISVAPIIIIGLASIYYFNYQFNEVKPSFKYFDKRLVKDIFGLGVKFFLINIQLLVMFQATNIIISNISSPIEVTNYNVAYKLFSVAILFFNIMIGPIWPAFTDAYVKKDFLWMKSVYNKMLKFVFVLIGCIILVFFASPYLYYLWIGNEVSISMTMSLCVAIYVALLIWNSLHTIMINGIGTIKIQTIISIVGMIIYLPISLFLGRIFGAAGVVSSMIIIYLLSCIVYTIQIRKLINNTSTGIWCK